MAQRTTRASRGEHTTGGAAAAAAAALMQSTSSLNGMPPGGVDSVQLTFFSAQKHIKVRKWRKVLVKVGQLKIPRWVPDTDTPNENLQNFSRPNKRALHKKAAKSRSRRKVTTQEKRHEVIGELDDWEN